MPLPNKVRFVLAGEAGLFLAECEYAEMKINANKKEQV
jgi:hypothetical protein